MKLADGKAVNVSGIEEMNVAIGTISILHDVWVDDIDDDIDCIIVGHGLGGSTVHPPTHLYHYDF